MTVTPLTLSIALSDNERTRPIIEGRHQPEGIRLIPTPLFPSEMFWRQLKYAEFDVSEMSLSSLIISHAQGDRRFIALPIYTSRRFFHTQTLVRRDSGIETPADLKGKRIGVPEYQQTSAIWSRGVLQHEFGVRPSDIDWYMERVPSMSHGGTTGFKPPAGLRLRHIPITTNIGDMLAKGELDGTLVYLTDKNLVDRSRLDISEICRPLFPDIAAEAARYFRKTGVYPINHTVVIKREIYEKHPWTAVNLYHAFIAAKQEVEEITRKTVQDYLNCGLVDPSVREAFDNDLKSYGLRTSREIISTISMYLHEQGLVDRRIDVEELFAPSTLDL